MVKMSPLSIVLSAVSKGMRFRMLKKEPSALIL